MLRLEGKVALVSGASKGIGAGIAKGLAAAGASVAVNYASDRRGAEAVVAAITAPGSRAIVVQGDVSKSADVARLFVEVKDRRGFLHDLGVSASSGRLFGIRAWSVIGFVNAKGTSVPRCMEPPVLFDHCFFGGCDIELEEQCLGLLDQLRYPRYRGYRLNLVRACSRLCARLACHSGPGILGAGDDLLDNRSTGTKQRRETGLYGREY